MIAQLSSLTFDLDGTVAIEILNDSDLGSSTRRVTRVATLDGGVAVNDFGYSAADRTIVLRWVPQSEEQINLVERLTRLYSRISLSSKDGFFIVVPQRTGKNGDFHEIVLLVIQEISSV
jgi:hypothetical protein